MARILTRTEDAVEAIFTETKGDIRLATPLGLGKPNVLLNSVYERARVEPSRRLTIFTALSLLPPRPNDPLAERFIGPFRERHWGKDYPELRYELDAQRSELPENVKIHEFYFAAGAALRSNGLQRGHQSINYTHVARSVIDARVNVLVQLIARKKEAGRTRYSLSCNPDVTLDLIDLYRREKLPLLKIGIVHGDLPFLGGEAEVAEDFFDIIVEDASRAHALFSLPRTPISPEDHQIGFHASRLIRDEGTLQIGIGSLSDAVVSALLLRQANPEIYARLSAEVREDAEDVKKLPRESGRFEKGLYGLSEMVTDGFMHLKRGGILHRCIRDEVSGSETYLHGAFYLGSKEFYSWLRNLEGSDFQGLRMSRISRINDLYDPNEILLRRQRKNARFLNTCMQVTLLGAAASETLEDGKVVSGVGGQYNFVSMSHELEGARSILMLRSTRFHKGKRSSNIVWNHGNLTIPRHLRDIVVTEYGIADLRFKSDEETIQALLNVCDSEFQEPLLALAKANGKISKEYRIPAWAKGNTPERIRRLHALGRQAGTFADFPFGSDFTPEEERLALALGRLARMKEENTRWGVVREITGRIVSSFRIPADAYAAEIRRMGFESATSLRDRILKRLVLSALQG